MAEHRRGREERQREAGEPGVAGTHPARDAMDERRRREQEQEERRAVSEERRRVAAPASAIEERAQHGEQRAVVARSRDRTAPCAMRQPPCRNWNSSRSIVWRNTP
jgi:hypothetical protein